MFKVPCTRQEAAEIYMQRRKQRRGYLKYDMYLGGMIGCSNKEFDTLSYCAFCRYDNCICYNCSLACEDAIQETLHLKWNEVL